MRFGENFLLKKSLKRSQLYVKVELKMQMTLLDWSLRQWHCPAERKRVHQKSREKFNRSMDCVEKIRSWENSWYHPQVSLVVSQECLSSISKRTKLFPFTFFLFLQKSLPEIQFFTNSPSHSFHQLCQGLSTQDNFVRDN